MNIQFLKFLLVPESQTEYLEVEERTLNPSDLSGDRKA